MLNKIYFTIALFCLNRINKTQYWQYETGTGKVVSLSVRKGVVYILQDDYYVLKNDLNGCLVLKDFEDNGVKIEILKKRLGSVVMSRNIEILENIIKDVENLPANERIKISNDLNNYVVNFFLDRDYKISKVNIIKTLFYNKSESITEVIYKVYKVGLFNEELYFLKEFKESEEYDNLLIYLSENNFIINEFIDDTMVD